MNRFEPNLRIPGPTGLPPAVREAGGRQMINHRGPEFAAMLERITLRLKGFFKTGNDIVLLSAAGTGGLEAGIVNTLSPGDKVLAVSIGAFGDRFAKIATTYGADVTKIAVEWGHAADPEEVRAALRDKGPFAAVLLTHNETSTGITNPMADLAAVVREEAPDTLLLVDGISGLGAVPFDTDGWGLDVVVTGSQKSWMSAPGLTMLSFSARAWEAAEKARMPRFYFDVREARKNAEKGQTPWTPAVAVVFQIDVALELMEREGIDAILARHHACGAATRAGLAALGFELFADQRFASDTVTAAKVPDELDWKAFNSALKKRCLVLAGGQGALTGKIFRVGHLGTVILDEILGAISVLEEVSLEFGRQVTLGAAVAAAQRAGLEALRSAAAETPATTTATAAEARA